MYRCIDIRRRRLGSRPRPRCSKSHASYTGGAFVNPSSSSTSANIMLRISSRSRNRSSYARCASRVSCRHCARSSRIAARSECRCWTQRWHSRSRASFIVTASLDVSGQFEHSCAPVLVLVRGTRLDSPAAETQCRLDVSWKHNNRPHSAQLCLLLPRQLVQPHARVLPLFSKLATGPSDRLDDRRAAVVRCGRCDLWLPALMSVKSKVK